MPSEVNVTDRDRHDIKPRLLAPHEGDACPCCGYDGTHDRNTGFTDYQAFETVGGWYDIVECGDCARTIKERGGDWDKMNDEPVDEADLEWEAPHAA